MNDHYQLPALFLPGLQQQLCIAVPTLARYNPHSGVGRVLISLSAGLGERVKLVDAAFRAPPVPILRNLPYAVLPPVSAQLVLLPQLTGAQALAHTAGVPGVVLVHDVGIVDFPGDAAGMDWITRALVKRSFEGLRYAQRVISVSHYSAARLLAHQPGLAERIRVVPNGVGEQFLGLRASRETALARTAELLGSQPGQPLLLNVGSELPRTNLELLFAAFAALRRDWPQATLVKVGAAGHPRWRAHTLGLAATYGLEPGQALRLIDQPLGDADLALLYRAADLFVSPSLYEGFGLPAVEAMACGTPVVVSDRGAYPEVVGAAGLVVPPDIASFAAALSAALVPETRARLVAAGLRRAAELTWRRAANQYLAIFEELLPVGRAARRGVARKALVQRGRP